MKYHKIHDEYLDKLVGHLEWIDEPMEQIEWVMSDGLWMPRGTKNEQPLCDIIAGRYDQTGLLAELKRSRTNKSHARQQLFNGRDFMNRRGYNCQEGKFVTYGTGKFEYEIIEIRNKKCGR